MHEYKGLNSRLDEIQAAILSVKLKYLDRDNQRRKEIAAYYSANIKNVNIILPDNKDSLSHVFHLYVIRTNDRERLQLYLHDKGIQTQIHYPIAIHQQPAYYRQADLNLSVAEQMQNEVLSLPLYPSLADNELHRIVEILNNY